MWAVVVDVEIKDLSVAVKGVTDQVIPMVSQSPGFVGGYWIRLDDGSGTSVVLYETESQAREAAPPEGIDSPGVKMTAIKVGEVIGHS
jgi:hypothetical protein